MFSMPVIFGFMRHILTALGGGLVADGLIVQSDMTAAVGAIMTLIGIIWSVVNKRVAA